jgi:hypothetical protein
MATHSWQALPITLAVVATLIGVHAAAAKPTDQAITGSGLGARWCAAGTPVPLTVAYLQSHLQKSARPALGDFDLVQIEGLTA